MQFVVRLFSYLLVSKVRKELQLYRHCLNSKCSTVPVVGCIVYFIETVSRRLNQVLFILCATFVLFSAQHFGPEQEQMIHFHIVTFLMQLF